MPDDTAAVLGKSFLGTSTTPVGPVISIHDPTTTEPTKLPQSPWESFTGLVEAQQAMLTPDEAFEALYVAIDY
jgi:hypothetical protein